MQDLEVLLHPVGMMEGDIHQREEDNDLSCLVVLGAFDYFQLVDSVRIPVQEVHILNKKDIRCYFRYSKKLLTAK